MPAAATPVGAVNLGNLPYIGPIDVLTLKMYAIGVRPDKRWRDAQAAGDMAQIIAMNGPIMANEDQKAAAFFGRRIVIRYGRRGRNLRWWRLRMP